MRPRRRVATWEFFAYAMILGAIAMWPTPVDRAGAGLLAEALKELHQRGMPGWIDYAFVESASNVLLFVPLGILVVWILGRRNWWAGGAAGLVLSALIELAQFVFLPARYPTLLDVAANTAGATLGGLLTLLVLTLRRPVPNPPPRRTL
ncbi:VanZ family protein [Arthrobacter sp. V4I6]|uniref:VanZ family protein n=1 Tax=unclassified Arthrobacter TaxID=235627 RepID=UPI00278037D5|nr:MULTISPECIES: VanZ family protein [unclassified Arthrobacter]MDQ0822099.1 VanZ family protein [Arthrobacter sp. V1I7]MDQ0856367.1 VanZ family protein [Arthrobacter sp. V4I6]